MLNQKNSITAMLLGLLFLTIPNLAYANSNQVDKLAKDKNILEMPLEFLYPVSAAKLTSIWRRERLYQEFKIEKQKETQKLVDSVNKIYKDAKINVKYVVHSVKFLDKNEASLYGVDDEGNCILEDSLLWDLESKHGLPLLIQDQKILRQLLGQSFFVIQKEAYGTRSSLSLKGKIKGK